MTTAIKLAAIALAALLLYMALAGLDWPAFLVALRSTDPEWLTACLGFEILALVARAQRWSMLLAYQAGPNFFVSFVAEAIGDLGNTFLPARAGEAMRTVMVARKLGLGMAFVIGTAATERVSDAVFVSLMAFVTALLVPATPVWLIAAAGIFCTLGIMLLLALSFLQIFNRLALPLFRYLRLSAKLISRIDAALRGIWLGAQALFGHPRRATYYLLLTMVFWLADAIAILCLANSFNTHLTLPEAALFLAALGLSSAVPSTPGYIGLYQFVAVSVLMPFGTSRVQALAIVLVYQVAMVLIQLLLGGAGWLWIRQRDGSPSPAGTPGLAGGDKPQPHQTSNDIQ